MIKAFLPICFGILLDTRRVRSREGADDGRLADWGCDKTVSKNSKKFKKMLLRKLKKVFKKDEKVFKKVEKKFLKKLKKVFQKVKKVFKKVKKKF